MQAQPKARPPLNPKTRTPRTTRRSADTDVEIAGIRITSADRVIDPSSGTRKLDLVRYYERIAPRLLPQLHGRPVSLVRAPQGVGGETFFQRHLGRVAFPGVTEHDGLDPGHPPLLTIDTPEALVGVAQMDTIELHTWNAQVTDIERPDRVVFDFDPDPALSWDRLIEAALLTRELLADLGLQSFCKTSGGKGLHVVVPLVRDAGSKAGSEAGWEAAKTFARAVAERLALSRPEQFSATMGAAHRKKKIFVDYLRNARGASTVAAWSARARPGMGVSMPLAWEEVPQTTGGTQWTITTVDARLAELGDTDPWAGYGRVRQRLTAALTSRVGGDLRQAGTGSQ